MNLGRARSLTLVAALMGCSTDTLVVATLDAPGGGGGEPGTMNGGGVGGDAGGGVDTARGGSTGPVNELEGEVAPSVCACIGGSSFVCSADGVTYDSSCASGCAGVVVACLHACPCTDLTGEGGAPNATDWVDERCFDSDTCPSGWLCLTSDSTSVSAPCGP